MIGHRVWLEAKANFADNVFGVIRKSKKHYESFHIFDKNIFDNFDVANWDAVEILLDQLKPDCIINAIGITIRKPEIKNIETALEINSFFPHRLLKWAQRNNSKVIHFSTDCVFSGDKGQYNEKSNPTANDTYGRTKFLGEICDQHGLTLRFSCIGRELDSHTELLEWFLGQNGKKVKGYKNAIYTGVTTHVIAKEVVRVIQDHLNLNGIFQLSSAPISKYDLLCLIREKYDLKIEIDPFNDYISDKSLNSDKYITNTNFKPSSWNKMIEDLKNDTRINYKAF